MKLPNNERDGDQNEHISAPHEASSSGNVINIIESLAKGITNNTSD